MPVLNATADPLTDGRSAGRSRLDKGCFYATRTGSVDFSHFSSEVADSPLIAANPRASVYDGGCSYSRKHAGNRPFLPRTALMVFVDRTQEVSVRVRAIKRTDEFGQGQTRSHRRGVASKSADLFVDLNIGNLHHLRAPQVD